MKKQMRKRLSITIIYICIAILNSYAQDKKDTITPQNILITPENPLMVKDTGLRKAVSIWCETQLKTEDYKKIKAHPSATNFPGKVKMIMCL